MITSQYQLWPFQNKYFHNKTIIESNLINSIQLFRRSSCHIQSVIKSEPVCLFLHSRSPTRVYEFEQQKVNDFTDSEDTSSQQQPQETSHLTEQAQYLKGWPLYHLVVTQLLEEDVHMQQVLPGQTQMFSYINNSQCF